MNTFYQATSGYACLAGRSSSWLIGRAPLLLASPHRPIFHESLGDFSLPEHYIRAGNSVTIIPDTIRQQRDKHTRVFFTFVQGQTPVTPPTLANTKENWMEEGNTPCNFSGIKIQNTSYLDAYDRAWLTFVYEL